MRYKNLDRFNKILIDTYDQVNLYYNNENGIYHDSKCFQYINGSYKNCTLYSRCVYFNIGHQTNRGIKRFGINLIKY